MCIRMYVYDVYFILFKLLVVDCTARVDAVRRPTPLPESSPIRGACVFYVEERQNKVQKKTDSFSLFTCGELSLLQLFVNG